MTSKWNGRCRASPEGEPSDPKKDFPLKQTMTDFSGKERHFVISLWEIELGYILNASEEGKEYGYEFSAFDANSPYHALGRLRTKMYRALSTRYLEKSELGYSPTHDRLEGRITVVPGSAELLLLIDGKPISLQEFARMILIYEGWDFRLEFVDRGE